ncbi:MAG TPA: 2-amino-4-hydroxy-6-hydroxymethyldihydropteridine diphosphokinase [Dehalococcoidia bacterium]|nr:2-amino-4-hydroxy-6-hydroxymethyldihydropteridine diphosphokinase [Dehalococcoidia bacterium]
MAVYIALGSNLGDRERNLREALRLLAPLVQVEAVSALYESEPQPPAPPPSYLNAACRVATALSPRELLRHLKAIEQQLGRQPGPRWSPRPIDLDIALYDDLVLAEPDLTIPHPRLLERSFVLQPLLDLDPELVHPVTGERLDDVLRRAGASGLSLAEGIGWDRSPS